MGYGSLFWRADAIVVKSPSVHADQARHRFLDRRPVADRRHLLGRIQIGRCGTIPHGKALPDLHPPPHLHALSNPDAVADLPPFPTVASRPTYTPRPVPAMRPANTPSPPATLRPTYTPPPPAPTPPARFMPQPFATPYPTPNLSPEEEAALIACIYGIITLTIDSGVSLEECLMLALYDLSRPDEPRGNRSAVPLERYVEV